MTRTQAVLIGGAFNGVLSALPFINWANCCCLWIIGGGVITAWLMQQGQKDPLGLGQGALGGLLAGVAGAVIYLVVAVPLQLALGSLAEGTRGMFETGDLNVPPEALQFFEMLEQLASSPALLAVLGFLMMLLAGAVFSTLGGLLGTFLFRKDGPQAPAAGASDVVPPPPSL